jgi:hypothetical protein
MIFVFATTLVVKSDTNNSEDNDTLTATATQPNSRDEGVGRKLTDLTEEITPVDDKSEELRSLILGLGIPSIILSIMAFFCMCVRGWQVEEVMRKLEILEQKISEGDINMTKDEILDYVKKSLSHTYHVFGTMKSAPLIISGSSSKRAWSICCPQPHSMFFFPPPCFCSFLSPPFLPWACPSHLCFG